MKAVAVTWVVVIAVVAVAVGATLGYNGYKSQHKCTTTKGADGKMTTTCTA